MIQRIPNRFSLRLSEYILVGSGLLILVSVLVLATSSNAILFAAAKLLYVVGVLFFLFNA